MHLRVGAATAAGRGYRPAQLDFTVGIKTGIFGRPTISRAYYGPGIFYSTHAARAYASAAAGMQNAHHVSNGRGGRTVTL